MNRVRFVNPTSDRQFVDLVETVMSGPVISREELQADLRKVYPSAVVRERDLSGEHPAAWYVYRDGHWVPPDTDTDEHR